jgi:small subunit ribosomal protein S16
VAVKIRLKRLGKIRAPYYRIVVVDGRTKRDGRSIEEIGKYHPTEEPSLIEVDSERAQYWLSVGAQPTEQVTAILKLTGDWGIFTGDKATSVSTVKTKVAKEEFSVDEKKKPVLKPKSEAPAKAPVADPVAEPVASDDTAAPADEKPADEKPADDIAAAQAAADADATEEIAESEGDKA